MNTTDFDYHMKNLRELDPDQLVSDLGLTTEEILAAFYKDAAAFIYKEFG
jgi:hypothetical protein